MRKENSVIRTKFISEAGSQLVNADYFAFVELDNYACYCIADGIDNDKVKESAKLAVTAIIDAFYQRPGMSKGIMRGYLEKAHQVLLKESGTFRLEASVLVIVTDYKKVRYANAGNARLYHWRNGRIINQSKDQSLTQNLVERGDLALDKLEEHEERHNLYCYAGQRGKFKPYVSKKIKMSDGDIISLATCGIWENTGIAELLDAIEDAKGPEDVCTGMEDIVLSQRLRNIQNYTFACIYVDKVYLNPNKQRNEKLIKKIVIPIVIVLVLLLIAFIISKIMLYRKIDSMWHNIGLAVEDMAENMDEEGNNSYESALKMYNQFDSKSELSINKVIEAKYFLNLFKYREDYLDAKDCYERYVAACKIMTSLVGKKGFERVENDGLTNKELSTSLRILDDKYLDKLPEKAYERYKEEFIDIYEELKIEYQIYMKLNETKKMFESEIKQNQEDQIERALEKGVLVYHFEDTEYYHLYDELKVMITEAVNANINLSTTLAEYEAFINVVGNELQYIKGKAYASQGEDFAKSNNFVRAKEAYEDAKNAYKEGKDNIYAGEINEIDGILSGLENKISDSNATKLSEELRSEVEQAASKFEKGKYSEAKEQCDKIKKKMSSNNITSGVIYDDLIKLQECAELAVAAEALEEEAKGYEKDKNYMEAYDAYDRAQKKYEEAGVSDKERSMRKKLNEINKILKEQEEQNKEEETE